MPGRFDLPCPRRIVLALALWSFPVCLCGDISAVEISSQSIQVSGDNNTMSVLVDGRPVLRYRYGDVPFKPYVKELYSPGGVQVLRDSPHDHIHHHALMFAVTVDRVDFWGENPKRKPGTQQGKKLKTNSSKKARVDSSGAKKEVAKAKIEHEIDWLAADKKPLLSETRTVKLLLDTDIDATVLTWQTRLEPAAGKESAKLSGSHYVGLGMRFVKSMDAAGEFFNSSGKNGRRIRGTEYVVPARWSAYTSTAGGKPVTVAIFDHPKNPRHPVGMFYMFRPFAYLSATLNLRQEPLVIKSGSPLALRYGVAVWDGKINAEKVEGLYRKWVEL